MQSSQGTIAAVCGTKGPFHSAVSRWVPCQHPWAQGPAPGPRPKPTLGTAGGLGSAGVMDQRGDGHWGQAGSPEGTCGVPGCAPGAAGHSGRGQHPGTEEDSDLSAHPCLCCPTAAAWPRFASNLNFIKKLRAKKNPSKLVFFFFFLLSFKLQMSTA